MKLTTRQYLLLLVLISCLPACAPVSSDFSCNKTAGDSCLTIEQVDSMTRYADEPIVSRRAHQSRAKHNTNSATKSKTGHSRQLYLSEYDHDKGVWIARG